VGGANYGPPSFSPRTGLVYVTGKNDAFSIKVKPVGDTVRPGKPAIGFLATIDERGPIGMKPSATVAAYDPATGERAWYVEVPNTTNTGNLVTAGDVVFQGVGTNLYAFDARSGKQLFVSKLPANSRASALTYQAYGRQFVAIAATTSVAAYGLP
jgi:glucose dehydrogenase